MTMTEARLTRRLRGSVSDVLAGHATHAVECADAAAVVALLPDASIDLMIQDVPYKGVVAESWDNQWRSDAEYLGWLGGLCDGWRRVLKPNGSLYVFASPDMAGRVECEIRRWFNVLNVIIWRKPAEYAPGDPRNTCLKVMDPIALHSYANQTERIIFAEQCGSRGGRVIGDAIRELREAAHLTPNEVDVALGYVRSANATRGTELCRRWEEGSSTPTPHDFQRVALLCNQQRDCADLRRPFHATDERPYTDVWDFPTVPSYPGKHICEKPGSLLRHIVLTSSRPDAVVLDCFTGSGSTGEAALTLGRRFLGGDASEHWAQYAAARLAREFGALPQTSGRTRTRKASAHPVLFGDTP